MVEKGIRGGICHAIHQYAKANNKYMKDYDKYKELPCLKYWEVNNLYGWAMSQNLPVNKFKWIKYTSQFNEVLKKNYSEESDEGRNYKKFIASIKSWIRVKNFNQNDWLKPYTKLTQNAKKNFQERFFQADD